MTSYFATSRSRHHVWQTRPAQLHFVLLGVLLFAVNGWAQEMKTSQLPAREVPKSATVEIVLLNAPGIDDAGSHWEMAYEFRISNEAANEAAFFEARKQGKSEERVGELIKDADLKKPLRSPENHKFVIEIPLSPAIQEQLRNQPGEHFKIEPGTITPERNKLLKEREIKFQVFMLYSVINLYDARLKKNILIPVNQEWSFAKYPDARFGFTIEINDDGSYQWKTSLPPNTHSPVLEIRKP